jgi:hypothetical protein
VDTVSLAEEMPQLFRTILDRVADLEHAGDRRTAMKVRSEAIDTYSKSWDARGRGRLLVILRRAERALPPTRPAETEVRESAVTTA